MKCFESVFCDLDGTILDDGLRHYNCYKDIVKKYGGKCIEFEEYWQDKRNRVKRTELLIKSNFGGTYEEYLNAWNEMIETEKYLKYEVPKLHAFETLQWLKDNSDHLILVTMRQRENTLLKQLTCLGIIDFFEIIKCINPIKGKKSDIISTKYNKRSIVIGDTEADKELAIASGCEFIAVTDGLRSKEFFGHEKYCINSFCEIMSQKDNFMASNKVE